MSKEEGLQNQTQDSTNKILIEESDHSASRTYRQRKTRQKKGGSKAQRSCPYPGCNVLTEYPKNHLIKVHGFSKNRAKEVMQEFADIVRQPLKSGLPRLKCGECNHRVAYLSHHLKHCHKDLSPQNRKQLVESARSLREDCRSPDKPDIHTQIGGKKTPSVACVTPFFKSETSTSFPADEMVQEMQFSAHLNGNEEGQKSYSDDTVSKKTAK